MQNRPACLDAPKFPPRHYIKHGAVYYVDPAGKWNHLGRLDDPLVQKRFRRHLNGSRHDRRRRNEPYPAMMRAIFERAKKNAKARGIQYRLTPDQERQLIQRANGCCELSGITFSADTMPGSRRRPFGPSLDRIDSLAPYTMRNCRIVCALANAAMSDWGEGPLRRFAEALAHRP